MTYTPEQAAQLRREAETYKDALERIAGLGRVCPEAGCAHDACRDSRDSWLLARAALRAARPRVPTEIPRWMLERADGHAPDCGCERCNR